MIILEDSINFSATGGHINTSDLSHVDGGVHKTGLNSFTIPSEMVVTTV
ncbi:hypothetical protein QWY92_03025 [Algibacter miyuki]|nr:hypothetical protein [Algibacter miyuki]MDN3664378.1 hypothetical protein [Algibacter miyuki]